MQNVLVIDSGSGGVNIVLQCLKQKLNFNFLLFIDQNNLPYGEKSMQKLNDIAKSIINRVDKFFESEIVVIACNTLTATSISFLRKTFPDKIFIGTEPAIKEAIKYCDEKDIAVLATKVTIENSLLLKDYQDICLYSKKLPQIIDENLFYRENIVNYIKNNFNLENKKAVVLGCTHFEGICDEIKSIYPNIKIFSSKMGVAKRLQSFCDESCNVQVQIIVNGLNREKFLNYFSLSR